MVQDSVCVPGLWGGPGAGSANLLCPGAAQETVSFLPVKREAALLTCCVVVRIRGDGVQGAGVPLDCPPILLTVILVSDHMAPKGLAVLRWAV